ncbi:MAG: arsenite methyltransferase [Saprospiraceae bacterium]
MDTSTDLKNLVKEKYSQIANQEIKVNLASCCGAGGESQEVYNIMTDDYSELEGHVQDADLGLGCGLPTQFAKIKAGNTVVDLGSGAGNDAFVARHETGPTGKVIGVDFVTEMIKKARANADKMGFNNVEFRYGDIEDMPISDGTVDVVVSNCVLNLLPVKDKIFPEIQRVLKAGGHFSISDIVLKGELPAALRQSAEMYAGCVAGAIQKTDYLSLIEEAGFNNVTIQKEKPIIIPDDILTQYLDGDALTSFKNGKTGIFSITVFAQKKGKLSTYKAIDLGFDEGAVCDPNSGCC